jgi:hypothetical protein
MLFCKLLNGLGPKSLNLGFRLSFSRRVYLSKLLYFNKDILGLINNHILFFFMGFY